MVFSSVVASFLCACDTPRDDRGLTGARDSGALSPSDSGSRGARLVLPTRDASIEGPDAGGVVQTCNSLAAPEWAVTGSQFDVERGECVRVPDGTTLLLWQVGCTVYVGEGSARGTLCQRFGDSCPMPYSYEFNGRIVFSGAGTAELVTENGEHRCEADLHPR